VRHPVLPELLVGVRGHPILPLVRDVRARRL